MKSEKWRGETSSLACLQKTSRKSYRTILRQGETVMVTIKCFCSIQDADSLSDEVCPQISHLRIQKNNPSQFIPSHTIKQRCNNKERVIFPTTFAGSRASTFRDTLGANST